MMFWGNYIKTPCEQCGTSHWAFAGTSSRGTRTLCRSCARAPSLTGSSVATDAVANVRWHIQSWHLDPLPILCACPIFDGLQCGYRCCGERSLAHPVVALGPFADLVRVPHL